MERLIGMDVLTELNLLKTLLAVHSINKLCKSPDFRCLLKLKKVYVDDRKKSIIYYSVIPILVYDKDASKSSFSHATRRCLRILNGEETKDSEHTAQTISYSNSTFKALVGKCLYYGF